LICLPILQNSIHKSLTGFNEELKIGFDYRGKHYSEYIRYYHNDDINNLEKMKKEYISKINICEKNGLNILIIPYDYIYTDEIRLRKYIKKG